MTTGKTTRKGIIGFLRLGLSGCFAIIGLLVCFSLPTRGQELYGSINGVVTDPNAATVPGAMVTATDEATSAVTPAMTDSAGTYIISNLAPGVYDLQVMATGFTASKQTGIRVEVGLSTNVNVHLVLAGQQETVTVTAQAPVVNTEQSVFGTDINQTAMTDLPVNTRRWSNFAILTPGAVPDGTFGDLAFRGMGYLFDNNTVDGAANTQGFFAEEVGRTRMAYSTSLESVQEYQVTTANYSAEYSDAVGAVINAVTKSGTNSLHGDAYYFLRDSTIGGTYVPFSTASVVEPNGTYAIQPIKPLDIRNQFGADAGGPIVKNKFFWYFNYDEQLRDFPVANVPLNAANFFTPITVTPPTGGCSSSDKLIQGSTGSPKIPTGQILDCRGITQAQVNQAVAFISSTTGTSPRTGDQTIFFPKLDWKPNANNTITGSYNRVRWKSPYGVQTNATTDRSIDSNGDDYVKDDRAIAQWQTTIGAWGANEARFIFSRDFEFEYPTSTLPGDPVSTLGLPPQADIFGCGYGTGGTTLACTYYIGEPYYLDRYDYPDERRVQGADTFSISKGKHLVKFGFSVIRTSDLLNAYVSGDQFGEYEYNDLGDYISDYLAAVDNLGNRCASTSGASIPCWDEYLQTVGPLKFTVPTVETGLFVQDDWRIVPRFTLNLGLRWDHEAFPSPVLPNPAIPQTEKFPSDNKDFAPRFGFAWDITGKGTSVLRGGYGVYFGRYSNEQIYDALTQTGNPGSQLSPTFFSPETTPVYPNILSSASISTPNVTFFPSDLRLPAAEEFDVVLEHQLWGNSVVSASYLGSIGRFLPVGIDTNLNQPSTITYTIVNGPLNGDKVTEPLFTGARPNPAYNQIVEVCSCGISHYNALVLQFNRHISGGLQFNFSYTYASDTDDAASASGGSGGSAATPNISADGPVNPVNLHGEEGVSNLEVRNRFVGDVIWEPPYFDHSSNPFAHALLSGWLTSVSEIAETGLPYIETISGNEPSGLGATISSGGPTGGATSTRAYFVPKNSNFLPPTVNTDVKLGRSFHITEKLQGQLSLEAFNLFNHVNYNTATGKAYTTGGTAANPTLTYSTSFGALTAANNGWFFTQRQLQWGAKLSF